MRTARQECGQTTIILAMTRNPPAATSVRRVMPAVRHLSRKDYREQGKFTGPQAHQDRAAPALSRDSRVRQSIFVLVGLSLVCMIFLPYATAKGKRGGACLSALSREAERVPRVYQRRAVV